MKKDHQGSEVWRYTGGVIARSPKGLIAEAFFNRTDLVFNGVMLKENDRFLELYLFEAWFNIYEIFDRDDGRLKAWYCNITRPVNLRGDQLSYDDLALDLFVYPDGRQLVLDEDEFSALELPDSERGKAVSALDGLKQIFNEKHPLDIKTLL